MRLRAASTLCFLLLGATPVALAPTAACAAEGPSAVLVVDATRGGGGQLRYCVQMPSKSVSGIELIELAGSQHGLDYGLGFGGNAVCRLDGVGPEGSDCFAEHPDFWGYWRGDGSGGWSWSSSGAGSTTVEDGDVEGWSWGSGQDGDTHPRPPSTTYVEVCGSSSDPEATKGGGATKPGGGSQADPAEGPEASDPSSGTEVSQTGPGVTDETESENDDGTGTKSKKNPKKDRHPKKDLPPPEISDDASITPEIGEPAGILRPEDEGPSLVGIGVLGLGILIAAGMGLAARRRTRAR